MTHEMGRSYTQVVELGLALVIKSLADYQFAANQKPCHSLGADKKKPSKRDFLDVEARNFDINMELFNEIEIYVTSSGFIMKIGSSIDGQTIQ